METLREQQSKFAQYAARLILFAIERGYEVTLGDAWASRGHIRNSLHYCRLAIDLNLFRNGKFLEETKAHEELGLFWESQDVDCNWGGHFRDGGHYEMCRPE